MKHLSKRYTYCRLPLGDGRRLHLSPLAEVGADDKFLGGPLPGRILLLGVSNFVFKKTETKNYAGNKRKTLYRADIQFTNSLPALPLCEASALHGKFRDKSHPATSKHLSSSTHHTMSALGVQHQRQFAQVAKLKYSYELLYPTTFTRNKVNSKTITAGLPTA